MPIPQLTTNLNYHQAQVDEPNDAGGLSSTQFKALCDQAVNDIKAYLNANTPNIYTMAEVDAIAANFIMGILAPGSVVDSMLSNTAGQIKDTVTSHLADTMYYTTQKLNMDSNGIYTEVDHKRADGTLILKSILSGGASPRYTTRTVTKYKADGTTVEWAKTFTITYDSNGNVASEVMA